MILYFKYIIFHYLNCVKYNELRSKWTNELKMLNFKCEINMYRLTLGCNAATKTKQYKTKLITHNNLQISIQINNSNTINLYFKCNI